MHRPKKGDRMGAAEWLEKKFDISPDIVSGIRVEIRGQERLILEGCRKILKYGENEMLLDLGKTRLCVRGQRLWCTSFVSGALSVGGRISSVSFEEEGT